MPWFDDYGEDNKIIDGEDIIVYKHFFSGSAIDSDSPTGWTKTDIIRRYRYVAMTYDAAVDCRDAISAPPDIVAQVSRQNDAGAYMVTVAETIEGDWSAITE